MDIEQMKKDLGGGNVFPIGIIILPYCFLCPIPIIMGCLMPFKHNLFLYHNAKQICCILADLLCIMI